MITCAHFSLSFIKLAVSIPFLCAFGDSFSLAPSDDDPAQKGKNSGNAQKIQVPQHLFILSCLTFPNGHILSQVQSTSLHLVDLLEW